MSACIFLLGVRGAIYFLMYRTSFSSRSVTQLGSALVDPAMCCIQDDATDDHIAILSFLFEPFCLELELMLAAVAGDLWLLDRCRHSRYLHGPSTSSWHSAVATS